MDPDAFLLRFHGENPGCTSEAFAGGRIQGGGSSYDLLADCAGTGADRGALLDLGCGDGYLLDLLVGRGAPAPSLIGVDMSQAELALAQARPRLQGARLIQARAQSLPLPDDSVDAVLSHLAWMLMSDVTEVVAEVRRVLRPGGVFAAMVGGGPKVGDAFELFLDLLTPLVRREGLRTPPMGDARCRSETGLRELLGGAAGFDGPPVIEDLAVDLSGSVDAVWHSLRTVYEMQGLSESAERELQDQFEAAAAGLAAGGRVPCSMFVRRIVVR